MASARPIAPAQGGSFNLEGYLTERRELVEVSLKEMLARQTIPVARLAEAIRYSLLAGGKRLRPILTLAACDAVGGDREAVLPLACSVEMVHTYSMIHDDLPCMDDDDLRRGRPTNHKVFGEAIATLAGDALLTDAFFVLAESAAYKIPPETVLATVADLAEAAGSGGMVGGQAMDILGEGQKAELVVLERLHRLKTGALFRLAVVGGARLGGASASQLAAFDEYARAFGLAFQIADDLLDVEGSSAEIGKRTGKDQSRGKATYPRLLGVPRSRQTALALARQARDALAAFDARAEPLRALATYAVERKR